MTIEFDMKRRGHYWVKLAVLSLMLLFSSCIEDSTESQNGASAVSITTATAEPRDISSEFTVSAEVMAYKRVYVAARMSGLIEEVNFEEGEAVSRGDVMARLDVRQQETELRRARAALVEAEDVYNRTRQLLDQDAATRAEFLAAERDLEQLKSDIELLELFIEYGEVRAPMDAVVTSRLVEVGNNISENERMFTIADLDLLVVRPGVSEMNLAGLEVGQGVDIKLDVYPDRMFRGNIRRIFPDADPETRLFTVEVEIGQDEDKPVIRPGYLARTTFTPDERRNVLTVPSETITERDGQTYIFVVNEVEGNVSLTEVNIGIRRSGYAEILSGLEEEMKVAAANLDALEDGSSVRVVGTFRRHGFRN
jgi:membrane fusion protein, multidrug efflux system